MIFKELEGGEKSISNSSSYVSLLCTNIFPYLRKFDLKQIIFFSGFTFDDFFPRKEKHENFLFPIFISLIRDCLMSKLIGRLQLTVALK